MFYVQQGYSRKYNICHTKQTIKPFLLKILYYILYIYIIDVSMAFFSVYVKCCCFGWGLALKFCVYLAAHKLINLSKSPSSRVSEASDARLELRPALGLSWWLVPLAGSGLVRLLIDFRDQGLSPAQLTKDYTDNA